MKNRSITYLLLFGICSMLAIMQSCQKTDDLEADINSLKDRVAALEKATEGLNTSFASLQALMQKNKVIIGITPTKDGLGYLLELSDGTSIKVMESEAVQASVPEFSVDEEGYWIYKKVIILISNICQEPMERKYQHGPVMKKAMWWQLH